MTLLPQDPYREIDSGLQPRTTLIIEKGFPDTTFDELLKLGVGESGQSLLDLGCGTGTLARGFANRGCVVTGADIDQRMLDEASRLAHDEQLDITWRQAPAENTELPSTSFDAVTAGQCWHWFNQEKRLSNALASLNRMEN